MNEVLFDILVAVGSFLAGVIGSLIGLGGGVIITPLLVLAFGIDIRYAMGAALSSVIATSSGAAAAYVRDGIANMRIGLFLCVATTTGAVCGALLAVILDQAVLSFVFGAALLVTVLLSLRGKKPGAGDDASDPWAVKLRLPGTMPGPRGAVPYAVRHVGPGLAIMWVAGLLSGLLGIGSGAFKVVAMDQVMGIPFKVTTATSNFMIGVTAAASVGVYLKRGYLDPTLVAPVALGVLAGAFVGARLLPVAPVKLLRAIFLAAVSVIAIQMIARGLHIGL
ncbi:MAG TPA: sulfite exporter TauE/SafE family protein, partial [Terrimicrobiaceae bacterium]|nr:sulfite exporter TauE/SafE family protein [Terrimicrobiaceae bacterium]